MTGSRNGPGVAAFGVLMMAVAVARPAEAQLDPLLFLKSLQPRVVIAVDLSSRMQCDLAGDYHDPHVYRRTGEAWEAGLGVTASTAAVEYRRAYTALRWLDPGSEIRAEADAIRVVGDLDAAFATFDRVTRLGIAKAAVARAIEQNRHSVAFGLLVSRQLGLSATVDPPPRVRVTVHPDAALPSDTGMAGEWSASIAETAGPGSNAPASAPLVPADVAGSNMLVLSALGRGTADAGALVAAGFDTAASIDAPILHLLEDAHAEASRLSAADLTCRNTIVVLIAAGDQEPRVDPAIDRRALDFLDASGRRVPVHVVALAPGEAGQALATVAAVTGGTYTEVESWQGQGDAVEAVHAVVRAINGAVQHGLARFADVTARPSPGASFPGPTDYSIAPPVVGTVNLEGATDARGVALPDTTVSTAEGAVIPQTSNVVFTAGFVLPGFDLRLRAFRGYRPEADEDAFLGYRFVADGTRLWTAAVPEASRRNLFTVIPGRGVVPFTEANAPLLAPYLRTAAPAALVRRIRQLPLGGVTHSTPALLTPPAETMPDDSYVAFAEANRNRRSLVAVGADDGMLHVVDARTGVEVWAVVPFNLLPKLRLLDDGQPLDAYRHFVGGSPRLADIRTVEGWKTILVVGEGAGGTFYQAFDVSLPGIGLAIAPDSNDVDALLGWFSDPGRVPFLWSFPRYDQFDAALGDHGDVAASATEVEKSVGETWSTPSVFRMGPAGPSVVVVGSGPLPATVERQTNRGGVPAGTSLYLLDAETGALLDSSRVASDGVGEDHEACEAAGCAGLKNALASDPAVLLDAGTRPASVFLGDLDGRLWRADVGRDDSGPRFAGPLRLLYGGRAGEPIFGSAAVVRSGLDRTFVFVATSSDLAPTTRASPPGRLLAFEETPSGVAMRGEIPLSGGGGGVEERASSMPALAGDMVFFSTTSVGGTACDNGVGRLYALTFGFGVAYDWSGDGRRDTRDTASVGSAGAGRVTPPVAADRHVLVAAGGELRVFGDPRGYNQGPGFSGVRVVSWREVY